jgi:hypothetical protein
MREKKGFIGWEDAADRKTFMGCPVAPDRVKVYYNLNLDCLSVIDAETGLLYCHAHRVELHDAKFRVQKAGRQRVLREKRKNVHAYIVGKCHDIGAVSKERHYLRNGKVEKYNICDCDDGDFDYCEKCVPESGHEFKGAYYNPYKYKTFVEDISKKPLFKSERVIIRDKTAIGPHFNIFYIPEPKKKRVPWNKGLKYTHGKLRAQKLIQSIGKFKILKNKTITLSK